MKEQVIGVLVSRSCHPQDPNISQHLNCVTGHAGLQGLERFGSTKTKVLSTKPRWGGASCGERTVCKRAVCKRAKCERRTVHA